MGQNKQVEDVTFSSLKLRLIFHNSSSIISIPPHCKLSSNTQIIIKKNIHFLKLSTVALIAGPGREKWSLGHKKDRMSMAKVCLTAAILQNLTGVDGGRLAKCSLSS